MPKQYRVVSQAAPVKGKMPQDVIQGLARLGMKAEQATALLQKPLTIKKDLDNPKALEYLEAPVLRVTGFDTPFPYALELEYLPLSRRILPAILETARY